MADISHISIPSFNIDGDINDTIARTTINNHVADKNNPHNVTKAQIGLGNVDNTSDMDKPISTAVQNALDKKANNTLATESSPGLMSPEDKKAVDREFFKLVPRGATYVPHGADLRDNQYFKVGTYYHDQKPSEKPEERGIIYGMPGAGLYESPLAGEPFTMYVMAPYSDKYDDESTADEMTLDRLRVMIVAGSIYTQSAFNRYKVVEGEGEPDEMDWFAKYWTKIADDGDIKDIKHYMDEHIYSKSNPHGVTKDQVGLGNVDNTADKDKSVMYAKQAYKAGSADYAKSAGTAYSVAWGNVSGKPSTYPPSSHTHTKDQVGLDNVDNTADKDKSVKYAESAGSANSVAWDNVTGKPTTMASSVAWNDVTDKPSTYPPSSHTHTPDEVGLGNVANLDQSKAIKSITRSGTTFTATALDGTTTTFTQQDADTTSVTWDDITDKPSTYPPSSHTHTPDEVGLGNVDNTADKDKSVKYATTAGTASSITWKNVSDKPSTYPPDAHTHTPSEVGLGNVDNTADIDKPISTAVQKALDGKANTSVATSSTDGLMSKSDKAKLDSIEAGSNVESVNGKTGAVNLIKADIGLSNVDNTADKDKSVKHADTAGSATNDRTGNDIVDTYATNETVNAHISNTNNPHKVTKAQVGLGNVDNTADKDKSVKYAESAGSANSVAWDDISGKPSTFASSVTWKNVTDKPSTYPPSSHTHTPSEVGLGNVDNTADKDKPISTAVQKALDNKVTKNNTADTNGLLNSLASEETTPTDADYYISQHAGGGTTTTTYHRRPMSALWAFIKSKCDSIYATVSALNAHISNKSNPHGVTKAQVGLGNVDNTADKDKSVKYASSAGSANSVAWGNVSGKPSTYPPSSHTHTPAQVGLGNVDNTADKDKSVKYAESAGSANSVAWGNVSGKPSTYPPSSHTHSYLPLSGGTLTGALTVNGKLSTSGRLISPTKGGTWSSGKDVNNAVLGISTQASSPGDRWDPIIAQKDYAGGTWNIGSIGNQVGVAGFYKDRIDNGTDWYHYIDTTNGTVHFNKQVYADVTGSLSGNATSANYANSAGHADTANHVSWGNVSGKPSTYPPSSHTHTKDQVGLGNVDNTADSAKSVKYAASAGSANSVAWDNVSGKPSTYPPAGHSHSYLPLSGGTVTGKLNAAGRLTAPTKGGTWSSGKDVNNAVLGISTQADSSWNPIIAQKDYAGGTWNIGSIYNKVGVAGFYKDRTANETDWYHYIDTTNGTVHFNKQVYADVTGSLSGNATSANYANSAGHADTVDGFHEDSFLRYRDSTSTNKAETLWNQIGIREYDSALPSGLSGVLYNYGAVVSLPGRSTRFDLYYSHHSSDGDGLYYRTGWGTDKKGWARLIDSRSIGSQSVKYATSAGHAASADYANSARATLDSTYPVGSIYMSMNSTSPASLFGGTWYQLQGKFLVGVDNTDEKYAANKIGFVTATSADTPNVVPYLNVYMWKRTA